MSTLLGRTSTADALQRMQERTMTDTCVVYMGGADDGRGGQKSPQVFQRDVNCAARPVSEDESTEFLGGRLEAQSPHLFFLPRNTALPDDCFILYDGVLYREENRSTTAGATRILTVRDSQHQPN